MTKVSLYSTPLPQETKTTKKLLNLALIIFSQIEPKRLLTTRLVYQPSAITTCRS